MKWRFGWSVLLAIFVAHCAENKLHTYMVVHAKTNKKKGEIELSILPHRLTMFVPDGEELEDLSENLKLTAASKYHRLPPLTFLKFEFENLEVADWKLEFKNTYFETANGAKFKVVESADYNQRFTSAAYDHFRYDAMYAGYITTREGKAPKESFWHEKKPMSEGLVVKHKEGGFQIVPVDFIPAGVEDLMFFYPAGDGKLNSLKIHLATERGG